MSCRTQSIGAGFLVKSDFKSLTFVFALAEPLEDGESRFLGIGNREWLEFHRRAEGGKNFPHWLLARGTIRQRFRGQRAVQRECPAAHRAATVAQFVFVYRHTVRIQSQKSDGQSQSLIEFTAYSLPRLTPLKNPPTSAGEEF